MPRWPKRANRKSRGPNHQVALTGIDTISGLAVEDYAHVKRFNELTVIDPTQVLKFEIPDGSPSMRVVDLMTPIGLGQRGLIAAPPRTGKTVLLQQMAAGLAANHPDVYMMVLLVDERPEEVTEMRRTVHGEVVSSRNDIFDSLKTARAPARWRPSAA